MKKKLLASAVLAALLSTTALADTSSMNTDLTGMGILENEWVRAGVNGTTGTFGSGGNASPGLLFDPEGTGTFNSSYDYLTPGSPFDGFSVKVDGTNYTNNNSDGGSVAIANDGNGLTDGENSLSWTGGVSGVFNITNTYSLAPNTPYIDGSASITMLTDATTLSFGKFIDPDSQGMPGDSSATDNVLGYGVIPETNVAFSEATVSRYALGIYTTDTNVTAGINGWSTEADGYNGTNYYKPLLDADGNIQWDNPTCTNISWCGFEKELDADGNPIKLNYGTSDDTIGISWAWSNVSTGDILTASYAYIFGPSAFDAASDAVEGGAGGGDTTTTDSWGTVEDVGSATDAASGATTEPEPEAPTVVSTTTETITSTSEAVSTTLPVLTASITHHTASETATVQTIDREKTTTVTTPVEVTTTSFDRTTTTYSDDSETVVDGESTSTVAIRNDVETTVTDPGSFTGRIDQAATAQDVVGSTLRTLDFNNIQGIRSNSKYDNGMSGSTTGAVVGGSKELENGVTISGGFTRLGTALTGNGDSVDAETTAIAAGISHSNGISIEVRRAMTDYTMSRTIGDFTNTGSTSGTDTSARIMFSPETGKVQPVIGYTRGLRTMDGYTEAGSIQSARTVADTDKMYGYGTVGLRGDLGLVDFSVMHHTDGVNDISLGLEKDTGSVTWRVEGTRSMTELGTTDAVSAGLVIKF